MAERATPMFLDNDEKLLRRAWHPVLRATELNGEGADVRLLGQAWSLFRDGGELTARDRDGGRAWALTERYGLVWLAPDEPVTGLPELDDYDGPRFAYQVLCRRTPASAGVLIDNFLDVTHFSYLHQRTFGLVLPVTVERYELSVDTWSVSLTHQTMLHEADPRESEQRETEPTESESREAEPYESESRESDDPVARAADLSGQSRIATYIYHPPFVTHLRMCFPEGTSSVSTLVCQPESATSTIAYVIVAWPAGDEAGLRAQLDLSAAVLEEDLSMVELLEDPRLPLSLKAELHTRADRAGVEMRRMLAAYLRACV